MRVSINNKVKFPGLLENFGISITKYKILKQIIIINSEHSTKDQPIFLIDQIEFLGLKKYLTIDTKRNQCMN